MFCSAYYSVILSFILSTKSPTVFEHVDILYNNQIAIEENGEPIVNIGLLSSKKEVRVRSKNPIKIDFYENNIFKSTVFQTQDYPITIKIKQAQKTKRKYYISLEEVFFNEIKTSKHIISKWSKRGYKNLKLIESGTLLGINGQTIDNRKYHIVLPTKNIHTAKKISKYIQNIFNHYTQIFYRLDGIPTGQLLFKTAQNFSVFATHYIQLTSLGGKNKTITIDDIEFGKGYSWHGRESRKYQGKIYIVVGADRNLFVVNSVGIETILAGVIPSELFVSSPIEALKAQVIAARNHILTKLGQRHHNEPFHLCAEQHCQVYSGMNYENKRTNKAIQLTRGMFLYSDKKLVHATYSSTCGGYTENNNIAWNEAPNIFLRGIPDFKIPASLNMKMFEQGITEKNINMWVESTPNTYCSQASTYNSSKFRWKKEFNKEQLSVLQEKKFPDLGYLLDIQIKKRGIGGKIYELHLVGTRKTIKIFRELPIRRFFNNLNSASFIVEKKEDKKGYIKHLIFKGSGWGHGVGMCQMGAIGRAEKGYSYQNILKHYYNNADIISLYGKKKYDSK